MSEIDQLIEEGVLIPYGLKDGERKFRVNEAAAKSPLAIAFVQSHRDEIFDTLMELVADGLVDFKLDDNMELVFGLTDEGRRYVEEDINPGGHPRE